jgi:nucleoside-diphosphate-sugar epimerase
VLIFDVYVFQALFPLIQNQAVAPQVSFDFQNSSITLSLIDYAIEIFHDALKSGSYKCYLRGDTRLPMMWIDDCIQSIVSIMEVSSDQLKQRTYNVAAMSFTPEELSKAIQKYKPNFRISYQPDERQKIGKKMTSFGKSNHLF